MTVIVSAMPGVGKSYIFKNQSELNVNCCDSDSSLFSWLPDGLRNPNFVEDYFKHIMKMFTSNKYDLIFISSHQEIRDKLILEHINYLLVIPTLEQKEEYLARFKARGNTPEFIKFMDSNWESLINSCLVPSLWCKVISLESGCYLSDIISFCKSKEQVNV